MEVIRFAVVLQGNVAFQGAIADTGLFAFTFFVELVVDDLFTV